MTIKMAGDSFNTTSATLNAADLSTDNVTTAQKTSHTVDSDNHIVAYIGIPIGIFIMLAVLAFIIVMILRKHKVERLLRHHLMPMYNYDPQEEDWESELLDEKGRKVYYREGNPRPPSPQLQFNT